MENAQNQPPMPMPVAVPTAPRVVAPPPPAASEADLAAVAALSGAREQMVKEVGKIIVGQEEVIWQLLIGMFARGHVLLVGVPGLAKTLLVRTVSQILSLNFKRIQFTPDLMPSDITGTDVIEEDPQTGKRTFRFIHGPLFTNLLLADEINRTPPKTQAALLEAMQEYHVTAAGKTWELPLPFFVLATQNPIEQEGTYPLPEAQQDRFMFNVFVDYPTKEEEIKIVNLTTGTQKQELKPMLTGEDILNLQKIVRRVPVADHVVQYAVDLVRATRPRSPDAPKFIKDWITWGAGPRAAQTFILAGKARAILRGRYHVACRDIQALAKPILRHRIGTNFNAEAEGVTTDDVVDRLLKEIPEPKEDQY